MVVAMGEGWAVAREAVKVEERAEVEMVVVKVVVVTEVEKAAVMGVEMVVEKVEAAMEEERGAVRVVEMAGDLAVEMVGVTVEGMVVVVMVEVTGVEVREVETAGAMEAAEVVDLAEGTVGDLVVVWEVEGKGVGMGVVRVVVRVEGTEGVAVEVVVVMGEEVVVMGEVAKVVGVKGVVEKAGVEGVVEVRKVVMVERAREEGWVVGVVALVAKGAAEARVAAMVAVVKGVVVEAVG